MTRFYVREHEGYRSGGITGSRPVTERMVIDRDYSHSVIASYMRAHGDSRTPEARFGELADAHAERLNREYAQ